ncbi:MAG: anion transporter [bacterium]
MQPWEVAAGIFLVTYTGVALGSIPGLALDRTGIALLGAIAMVALGVLDTRESFSAIHTPTILLLYSLMVLSAQFRLGGFYTHTVLGIVGFLKKPKLFLLVLMAVSALLSSVLANDIVCLAFTPVVCVAVLRASLNPIPFLIGMACASNLGSAATIIGNPQNMLIGQLGQLDFGPFVVWCAPPSIVSVLMAYLVLLGLYRGKWTQEAPAAIPQDGWPSYDRHQSRKGLLLTLILVAMFFTPVPRELTAISVAGVVLLSRRFKTRAILGLVDWHLITLFCALFIVVEGVIRYGIAQKAVLLLAARGFDLDDPWVLTAVTAGLSNIVSNVPAVMLLLRNVDLHDTVNLYLLALISTYAGNLITIGSIANLITIEGARAYHVEIGFREHARVGVPVTALSILVALCWMTMVA